MKISFSAYRSFKECPRKYWYDKKIREIAGNIRGPYYADAEIGNVMHSAFYERMRDSSALFDPEEIWNGVVGDREMFDGRGTPEFSSLEEYAEYLRSMDGKLLLWSDEKKYLEKISKLIDGVYRLVGLLESDGFETEKWFSYNLNSIRLYGKLDLVRPGEIIDLKTGKRNPNDEEQMKFYSLLYYKKHNIVPRARLIYLMEPVSENNPEELKFEEKDLESLEKDVISVVNEIREGVDEAHKGDHCRYCPYRNICRQASF